MVSFAHQITSLNSLTNPFSCNIQFHQPFPDKASFYESGEDVHEKGENRAEFDSQFGQRIQPGVAPTPGSSLRIQNSPGNKLYSQTFIALYSIRR